MNIFKYSEYKEFLIDWIKAQPSKGRGIAQKLSLELKVSTVLMSQILSGTRTLQADYAYGIANFIGLNADETEYFLTLVQYHQAGTHSFKQHLKKKVDKMKSTSSEVKARVSKDIHLSNEAKAEFYSHWHYSVIRLITDIPGHKTSRDISKALEIEIGRVQEVLDFLVKNRLCAYEGGEYKMAIQSTHLESSSPWIYSRQIQWRQKGIQKMERERKENLYYTGPMVISKDDRMWIKEKLIETIRDITEKARMSPSENLMCLNIDWFDI
jgi:uncharacterized protein (TIGR02147 family)